MTKSLWAKFGTELNKATCDWCNTSEEPYHYEGELVCRECLEAEDDEEHPSLTNKERNSI